MGKKADRCWFAFVLAFFLFLFFFQGDLFWADMREKRMRCRNAHAIFFPTSTTTAASYCGSVTDEDWSFVNMQIGFQVLSLITVWFYWWETTDSSHLIYLAGQSHCFKNVVRSPFLSKDWPGADGNATQTIAHFCNVQPLHSCIWQKQWKTERKSLNRFHFSLPVRQKNAPGGAPDTNQSLNPSCWEDVNDTVHTSALPVLRL